MKDRTYKFLKKIKKDGLSTEVDQAIKFWKRLKKSCVYYDSHTNPSTIGVDTVGNIHFSWNLKTLYLECEIFQDRDPEGFYEYLLADDDINVYETALVKTESFNSVNELSQWIKKFVDGLYL